MTDRADRAQAALRDLRYGCVVVNAWSGLGFLPGLSWGAFPGHTREDLGSGLGQVGNTSLVEGVEKSVLCAPCAALRHQAPPPSRAQGSGLSPRPRLRGKPRGCGAAAAGGCPGWRRRRAS